jgi:hypothetical protein
MMVGLQFKNVKLEGLKSRGRGCVGVRFNVFLLKFNFYFALNYFLVFLNFFDIMKLKINFKK